MKLTLESQSESNLGDAASWHDTRPRVLGRSAAADVEIAAPGVSREHCAIELGPAGFVVSDLASINGTWVNGQRIVAPTPLADGDTLSLGSYRVRVRLSETEVARHAPRFTVESPTGETVFAQSELRIGRKADCQLVLEDPAVSRTHCVIEHTPEGFRLVDSRSRNGSFINGMRCVSALLADGDRINIRSPAAGSQSHLLHVKIEGEHLRLSRGASTGSRESMTRPLPSRTLRALAELSGDIDASAVSTLSGGARATSPELEAVPTEDPEPGPRSRVIRGLEKQRAHYRGQKWVPTSDLLPNRFRRLANIAAFALVLASAAWALAGKRLALLAPGPLASVHRGATFEALRDDPGALSCRACHARSAGMSAACSGCHEANPIPPPHGAGSLRASGRRELGCASCHLEHRGDRVPINLGRGAPPEQLALIAHPPPALPVELALCRDCHARAHSASSPPPSARAGQYYLGVFYSSAWVHTLHARKPQCSSCHASEQDQESGRVTAGCESCHRDPLAPAGAPATSASADCLSCHALHRPGPLMPAAQASR